MKKDNLILHILEYFQNNLDELKILDSLLQFTQDSENLKTLKQFFSSNKVACKSESLCVDYIKDEILVNAQEEDEQLTTSEELINNWKENTADIQFGSKK